MKKLIAIGEALIDFIPQNRAKYIMDVEGFSPCVGGAPANVCGAFSKLGGASAMLTMLGDDPFGNKIIREFNKYNIDTKYILRTNKANTSLAFVSLDEYANREFSFYRKMGADMLLEAKDIKEELFKASDILHFCSVSLGDFPMKKAHLQAISYADKYNLLISFDPNIRKPLWNNLDDLYKAIWEFIPKSNILKISDEELEFITNESDINKALNKLFIGNVSLIVYTMGNNGALIYSKCGISCFDEGFRVDKPVDTTGAGDGFIGSLLYKLTELGINRSNINDVGKESLKEALRFANKFSSISVKGFGAIASYPNKVEF